MFAWGEGVKDCLLQKSSTLHMYICQDLNLLMPLFIYRRNSFHSLFTWCAMCVQERWKKGIEWIFDMYKWLQNLYIENH